MVLPRRRDRSRDRSPSPFRGGGFLDELFQDLEESVLGSSTLGRFGNTDVYEKDGKLHYEIELPGLTKEEIETRVQGDQLIVSGETTREDKTEEANYLHRGRRYGRFRQTFTLPEEVEEPEQLKAKFENGILKIEVELSESLTKEDTFDVEIE